MFVYIVLSYKYYNIIKNTMYFDGLVKGLKEPYKQIKERLIRFYDLIQECGFYHNHECRSMYRPSKVCSPNNYCCVANPAKLKDIEKNDKELFKKERERLRQTVGIEELVLNDLWCEDWMVQHRKKI